MRSVAELESAGIDVLSTPEIGAASLSDVRSRNQLVILDVRGNDEWEHGHIPGALHIPLGSLQARLREVPTDARVGVHCQGGSRSLIAASILQKNGVDVANIAGGFAEWERSGGPTEVSRAPGRLELATDRRS